MDRIISLLAALVAWRGFLRVPGERAA